MSNPFLGEIITFAGEFAIRNYSFCNGQMIAINQNEALYALLGTMYGGDARVSFGLPELRGRGVVSPGNSPGTGIPWSQGLLGGREKMTLDVHNLPPHHHALNVSKVAPNANASESAFIGQGNQYASQTSLVKEMYADTVGQTGGNASVSLMSPFLAVNFMIAISGLFPQRS